MPFAGLPVWIWFLLLPIAIGLAMIFCGWRGRRVGDHPYCARCDFDLTGRPDASTRCAECGADLSSAGTVQVGSRQRRTSLWMSGTLLAVASLLFLGTAIWLAVSKTNLAPYKPYWLLCREIDSADPADGLAEVLRRATLDELTAAQWNDAIDRALAVQLDRKQAWDRRWQDIVVAARQFNRLDDARWAAYAKQTVVPTIRVRPIVARGDPLPIRVEQGVARGGERQLVASFYWSEVRLDGKPLEVPFQWPLRSGNAHGRLKVGSGTFYTTPWISPSHLDNLPVGRHTLTAVLQLKFYRLADLTADQQDSLAVPSLMPVVEVNVPVVAAFDLVEPADAPPLFTTDPALREKVVVGIHVQAIRRYPQRMVLRKGKLDMAWRAQDLPVNFFAKVFIRPSGTENETLVGSCQLYAQQNFAFREQVEGIPTDVQRVDVIFRPDAEGVRGSLDTRPAWGEELILSDLPVVNLVSKHDREQ